MPTLETFRERLRSVVADVADEHGVPGAVVGVRRGDERALVAVGTANLGTGVEMTEDTVFQIGAVSKLYTSTIVLQLVHAGLVELDEPIRGALQEFRVEDDSATLSITPRHLLAHTSGIQGDHFLDCGRNADALWRYVSTLEEIGQLHAPDDLFSYCNSGFGVLGRLVEEVTGDRFDRALHRRLFKPLGLRRSFTSAEQAIIHRVAAGHHQTDDGLEVTPWVLNRFNTPIGGILATADDVLDFTSVILRKGRGPQDHQIIPGHAVTQLLTSEVEVPGTDEEWGLGWHLWHWDGATVGGHDGDTVGQRAFLRVIPDADAAIVVLTNSARGDHIADAAFSAVGAELLNLTVPGLPEPLPSDARGDDSASLGIFERMHQRLAIAGGDDHTLRMTIIPDELFRLAGRSERTLTLEPVDEDRFVTTDPATGVAHIVTMIRDDDGAVEYVHFGLRAHARIA